MAVKTKTKRGNVLKVDMTGVEAGGVLIPQGNYSVEVEDVEVKNGQTGKPNLSWKFTIMEGKFKGSKLFYNTSLQPQALFNLKRVLLCLGVEVPDSTMNLDLSEVIGLSCDVEVGHEDYDGKLRARITEFIQPDLEEEVSLDELDLEGLIEVAKEYDITIPKKLLKNKKKLLEFIKENITEDEEADDEEDSDDEPEEEETEEDDDDSDDEEESDDDDSDDDDSDDDDSDEEEIELDTMELGELVLLAEKLELKVPAAMKKSRKKLLEFLKENIPQDEEDEEEEEEEEEKAIEDMTLSELLAFAKEAGISLKSLDPKVKRDVKKLRKFILEQLDDE